MSLTDLTLQEKKDLYYDVVEGSLMGVFLLPEIDYIKDLIIKDIDEEELRTNGE